MHGLALNVSTDLAHYGHIVPCGISDRSVTSLAAEIHGAPPSWTGVAARLMAHLGDCFGARIKVFPDVSRARAALDGWLDAEPAPRPS
jgi:lipoyl(octanoyl) transferase